MHGVFSYPFDSLSGIGRLKAENNRFRIFNWNIPKVDGTNAYYGYILLPERNAEGELFYKLTDISSRSGDPEKEILYPSGWFGALYYTIINIGDSKDEYYTLLGWNGRNNYITSKLIDVLTFNSQGEPSFGAPIFLTPEGLKDRVILEYAKNISMVLKWDEQTLKIPKGKNGKYVEKKSWMIVMDHLMPIDKQLTGQRRYYVPSGEIYDAYVFQNNKWVFVENVKVENPSPPSQKKTIKPVQKNLFPTNN
jgi:hypothetical protein